MCLVLPETVYWEMRDYIGRRCTTIHYLYTYCCIYIQPARHIVAGIIPTQISITGLVLLHIRILVLHWSQKSQIMMG